MASPSSSPHAQAGSPIGSAGLRVACRWPPSGALSFYLLTRLLIAFAAAWPTSAAMGSLVWAEPDGDRVLWGPGAEMLVDLADRLRPLAGSLASRAGLVIFVGSFLMLVPLALLLQSMTVRAIRSGAGAGSEGSLVALPALQVDGVAGERRLLRPLLRAAGDAGTLALLQGLTLLVQVAAFSLVVFIGALTARSLELGREGQIVSQGVAVLAALTIHWLIGLWQDVARVAIVQHALGLGAGIALSFTVLGQGLGEPLRAALWRGVVALGLLLLAGAIGARLAGGGAPDLGVAVALHLAALALAVVLRVSWLRWLGARVGGCLLRPADR